MASLSCDSVDTNRCPPARRNLDLIERLCRGDPEADADVDLIDLRTLSPWDEKTVFESVAKTKRCLIVHEDGITCGFGAEIAATIGERGFFDLDAPLMRLGGADIPVPYNPVLMEAALPSVGGIRAALEKLLGF